MSKVLAVVGSPRKGGNTEILVSRIAEGAASVAAAVEMVRLGDLHIRECDGCHACWRGRPCSKDDDMRPLYEKIAACDVLVFATPVYWYGPTALMKAFVDRFVYFQLRGESPDGARQAGGGGRGPGGDPRGDLAAGRGLLPQEPGVS